MQTGNQDKGRGRLPWAAIAGGLVAAVAFGLLALAWQLGGARRAEWIEQPVAAPALAGANTGTKS